MHIILIPDHQQRLEPHHGLTPRWAVGYDYRRSTSLSAPLGSRLWRLQRFSMFATSYLIMTVVGGIRDQDLEDRGPTSSSTPSATARPLTSFRITLTLHAPGRLLERC
ncbi:hypothetical protein MRB53_042078 [Persea americana]|nr:hypothetical protein MRB53_042078 [Persea americana]